MGSGPTDGIEVGGIWHDPLGPLVQLPLDSKEMISFTKADNGNAKKKKKNKCNYNFCNYYAPSQCSACFQVLNLDRTECDSSHKCFCLSELLSKVDNSNNISKVKK